MKKKIYISLFSIILIQLLLSCSSNNVVEERGKYVIPLQNELKHALVSDFVENVKIVELETNENSLFGGSAKLIITNDRIYVLDIYSTKTLYVFDRRGKFIQKLRGVGSGPGEYIAVNDFAVDEQLRQILLLVDGGRRVIFLDYNLAFIRQQNLNDILFSFIFSLKSNYMLVYQRFQDVPHLLYEVDKNLNVKQKYIPNVEEYRKLVRTDVISYTGYNFSYLFAPTLSSTIYAVSESNCTKKYEFDLNEKFVLTPSKMKKLNKYDERTVVEETWDFFSLSSFFDLKNSLFATFSFDKNSYWSLSCTENNEMKYVNVANLLNDMNFNPKEVAFQYQINENTISGFLSDSKRDELLNPRVIICRMKD